MVCCPVWPRGGGGGTEVTDILARDAISSTWNGDNGGGGMFLKG